MSFTSPSLAVFPILTAALMLIGILVSYSIAVDKGDVPAFVPLIRYALPSNHPFLMFTTKLFFAKSTHKMPKISLLSSSKKITVRIFQEKITIKFAIDLKTGFLFKITILSGILPSRTIFKQIAKKAVGRFWNQYLNLWFEFSINDTMYAGKDFG